GYIALSLSWRRPEMDVGGNGYIPFGDAYTYYYSLTDLATAGTLRLKGQTFHVTGISWMDHQWGNWSWQAIKGWTWMALQLDNGTQLSVFDFRGTKRVRAASVLPKGSGVRTLYGISIASRGTWLSPHTHGRYPSGWTVRIPGERAVLTVMPSVRDQELISPVESRASYWEGSGRVTGNWMGRRVTGLSYTELTGDAQEGPDHNLRRLRRGGPGCPPALILGGTSLFQSSGTRSQLTKRPALVADAFPA